MCWSPCGQYLAAGSPKDSAFAVWDVTTREWCAVSVCRCYRSTHLTRRRRMRSTRLRSGGIFGARVLRWSPRGDYLLVAGFTSHGFEIWETHTWFVLPFGACAAARLSAADLRRALVMRRTSRSWSTSGHFLTDAAWSADEGVLLIALSDTPQMAVLHFVGGPPSLLAHLLPLDLPGLDARVRISGIALDSGAQQLAVACVCDRGDQEAWVGVFALKSSPVFAAQPTGKVLQPAAARLQQTHGQALAGVAFRPMAAASTRAADASLAVSWPRAVCLVTL